MGRELRPARLCSVTYLCPWGRGSNFCGQGIRLDSKLPDYTDIGTELSRNPICAGPDMGSRQKPRFRMVLPVSIWGTDSSGKAFHQLAYTVDISTGGARLAGLVVTLKPDDIVAVRYKQHKARFRVVWAANKQVGIQYLEGEKFIWIELPEEEYIDREPVERSPAPPGASVAAGQAEIEIRQQTQPQEEGAPVAGSGDAAARSPTDELAAALQKCLALLRALDDLVTSSGVVPQVAREFHAAAGHLRNSAWALQQWVELEQESKDTASIIESVNAERVRFTTQLCRELAKEQQHLGAGVSQEVREALVAAVQMLAEQFGVAVPTPTVHEGCVREPATVDPVVLLAGLNDEIRSSTLPPEETLKLIAERARSFTHADGAAIALRDEDEMVCWASAGIAPLIGVRFSLSQDLAGEVIATGHSVICTDTEQDARVDAALCRSVNLRSSAIVPVRSGDSVIGLLQVFSGRPNAFDDSSASLLSDVSGFVASFHASLAVPAEQH
jgi:GAF domain-containing protein